MLKTAGIIFADSMEYSPFLLRAAQLGGKESIRRGNESVEFTLREKDNILRVIGVKCGIGKVNAASAASFLISDDNADFILNAGLSGAIQKLRREDMVAATDYIECDFDLTAIGYGLGVKADGQKSLYESNSRLLSYALESSGIKKAKCGTGDIFLADPIKKELFKNTFNIDAFDMESAAIAGVCDKCGIAMLSLRKISDDAGDSAYETYKEMNNRQETCLTELIENILKRYLRDIDTL